MKLMCEVASCGAELSEGTGSKGGPHLCPGCRTSSYYWKKQSLAHMRERRSRLGIFTSRLEYYDPRVAEIVNEATKTVAGSKRRAHAASASARH